MRRWILFLAALFLFLAGCGNAKEKYSETVTFYYLEKDFDFENHGSILAPEIRDVSDHRRDMPYLMALYLMGPAEESHLSPLPAGTRISFPEPMGNTITLELSDAAKSLTDANFALASACLSQTCFAVTDAQQVTIINTDRRITMDRNSLLLVDNQETITEETS